MLFFVSFVQLAKKLHPDMNKDDPEAEKKFQEVSKAYEVSFDFLDEIIWFDLLESYTQGNCGLGLFWIRF